MTLRRNLIANYIGQAWVALMSLAFIPLYIAYLGIEAYGLIGMFAVLQAWLVLLDMGMKPTLNREMARFTGGAHNAESIRDLLRSIEVIAVGVALAIGLGIWLASMWLASDWLRPEVLTVEEVARAFTIMGAVTAMRFIEGVYSSCVIGLQRQVEYNSINSILATVRGLGAVGILIWLSPTIEAFFIWQGLVSLMTLGVFAGLTYRHLPRASRPGHFSLVSLRAIGQFAGGVLGITFLALLLTQVDKILLSKLLPLREFGYYTLATIASGALYMLVGPIVQAWFPRLSELHASDERKLMIETYHQGAQLVSVLMGSAAIVLIVFAERVLEMWTQDGDLAHRSATLLSLLALGNLLNGLMWMPYHTQLAYGWTSLATRINFISVTLIVPAILWITPRYGAEGAAWVWVGLNFGYVFIGIHFMYRKILTQEKWRWYGQDVIQPLAAATVVASLAAWVMPDSVAGPTQALWIVMTGIATLVASAIAAPRVREVLLAQAARRIKSFGPSNIA